METRTHLHEAAHDREPRTNLFVLATMTARGASGPVRIRNLSPCGAMIEGASLPAAGERYELTRGANSVGGRVVWCAEGRAGLRFEGRVEVAAWMPSGHAAQLRVDQVFQQIKTIPAAPVPVPAPALPLTLDAALSPTQLRRLARDIESLADDLADDAAVVARFATKLQTLDLASQALRKLSEQDAPGP